MNIKKIVLNVMEKRLGEMGYYFNKELSLPTLFVFSNQNIGFGTGLYISKSKWDNTLTPMLRISPSDVCRDMFYIIGVNFDFKINPVHYTCVENLSKYLQQVLELFISKGHQWIVDNSIKMFDVLQVYEEIIDNRLQQLSFQRSYTDQDILNGGKVMYKRNNLQLSFEHYRDRTNVCCFVDNGSKKTLLLQGIFDDNTIKELYRFPAYIYKEEYVSILETYIEVFSKRYASVL